MRKTMLCMVLLLTAVVHATEENDTTVIKNARQVMVITNDSLQQVKVLGKENDDHYVYENTIQLVDTNYVSEERSYRDLRAIGFEFNKKNSVKKHTNTLTGNFGLGVSAPTNVPDGIDLKPMNSVEAMLWVLYNHTPFKGKNTFSAGLGFTARSYGLGTHKMFTKNGSTIGVGDYPEGSDYRRSSLYVGSLSVPFFYTHDFGKKSHFKLTLGPVVNFNLFGSISNRYEISDANFDYTIEAKASSIGQRPITVDFMGVLRFYGIGVYMKYSPQSVLKTDRGPQFHALSFGLFF